MTKGIKKVLALLLAMMLVIGLAACGGGDAATDAGNDDTDAGAANDDANAGGDDDNTTDAPPAAGGIDGPVKVAYIAKNTVDVFHAPINAAAAAALDAMKADGTIEEWQLFDGETDPVTQISHLDTALNMGFNMVIVLPAESAACDPIVEKCSQEGVPVVVVNSKTENTDALATAYVGSDDVQAGEIMANFVIEQIPDGGGYGHLQGIIGNSAQIERGQGIHNIMDGNADWEMLDEQGADWQADKARNFATDWLTQYGEGLNAIICDNDDMSSAVQSYVNSMGRSDIICIGVDGNAGPLQMISDGELLATVYQDGVGQVEAAINLIPAIAAGESVSKEIMVDFVLITSDNVAQYI